MTDVQGIREAIQTRLATIDGLRAHAIVPSSIVAPAAVVRRQATIFDSTMGGESDDLTFAVTVFVEWTNERVAQQALDAYLDSTGTKSIKAAIEGDATLDGTVGYARVTSVDEDRVAEWDNVKYLAADLIVETG